MRWTVHGERPLYASDWVSLTLADVELPDGRRFGHHVVRIPQEAAALVVHDDERGVLLLHRHRFVVDAWGWEIPGGRIDEGESPAEAAAREALEETGWRPGALRPLFAYHPISGLSDQRFHVFAADGATFERDPDRVETDRVEWVALPEVRRLIASGEVTDGFSLTALLWFLTL
ncbi:MAG TPA: NUDIX hydrolase [Gaiellaceae bacterium]|nr:NUDIX hydrolase [Gaiellaceae bacterium]